MRCVRGRPASITTPQTQSSAAAPQRRGGLISKAATGSAARQPSRRGCSRRGRSRRRFHRQCLVDVMSHLVRENDFDLVLGVVSQQGVGTRMRLVDPDLPVRRSPGVSWHRSPIRIPRGPARLRGSDEPSNAPPVTPAEWRELVEQRQEDDRTERPSRTWRLLRSHSRQPTTSPGSSG